VVAAAEKLANTPTVRRTSYVHDAVVAAFEEGALASLGKQRRSAVPKPLPGSSPSTSPDPYECHGGERFPGRSFSTLPFALAILHFCTMRAWP
jgi:hypothetical protein